MSANINRAKLAEYGVSKPSGEAALWVENLNRSSIDWLWAAEQAETPAEKYFCLAYALYLNPDNAAAHRAIQQVSSRTSSDLAQQET